MSYDDLGCSCKLLYIALPAFKASRFPLSEQCDQSLQTPITYSSEDDLASIMECYRNRQVRPKLGLGWARAKHGFSNTNPPFHTASAKKPSNRVAACNSRRDLEPRQGEPTQTNRDHQLGTIRGYWEPIRDYGAYVDNSLCRWKPITMTWRSGLLLSFSARFQFQPKWLIWRAT